MSSKPPNSPLGKPPVPAEPIAIIGIGCMFPKAKDLENYWANIRDGIDAITETPPTHWQTSDYYDADPDTPDMTYGRRGGFLDQTDFDPLEFGISPRDVEATDTSQLLGMAIAKQALADAGYPADSDKFARDRVSVVIGVTGTLELVIPLGARLGHPIWRRALRDAGVDQTTADDVVERIRDSYVGWQENSFPGLLGNVVAGRIANRLDLHGTNCVVDSACASSLSALHLAVMELQAGKSDMVVTGGVDAFNDIFMYMCFSKTPALSPSGDAKPFAASGDGTILGEGLGMMVLKRVSEAERDGDQIYAVIRGIGSSSDGKGNAVYAPSAEGQARALRNAYANAGVDPSTIELVEAHGTGTKVGDATEIRALASVYRESGRQGSWCALGSVKSMIGHTKAAAGAAGLIKAAMALYHKVLPPTLKVSEPNEAAAPGTTPFYVNTEMRPWMSARQHPRRAGISAFGFGGSNFHCVLEEYVGDAADKTPAVNWDGRVQLLPLAAHDRDGLRVILDDLLAAVDDDTEWTNFRGLAAKARTDFDGRRNCRLAIVVDFAGAAASKQLQAARDLLDQHHDAAQWSSPLGIWFGAGERTGKVGVLFPGQGSQYPGMLRELQCRFPAAQDALVKANAAGEGTRLSDCIYPHPAFDEATRRRQADALRQTDVAQPAIGAVSLGAWKVLQQFGIEVGAATGHSYGELTALHAAGHISEVDFHNLSWLRGKFMARGDGDRGRMLAVFAEQGVVEDFLGRHQLDLVLANRNAPSQSVLSGPSKGVERAAELLHADNIPCKLLPVAAAFHSPLVAEASAPFGHALADIPFHPGRFPVFANTSAEIYPAGVKAARSLLAGHLAAPVEFQRCVENMRKAGVTTFVEVGPGSALTGLCKATLQGDPGVQCVALDATSGRNRGDLANTLACLIAAGHNVDLAQWDAGYLTRHNERLAIRRPVFTVPINGANYVAERPVRPPTVRPAREVVSAQTQVTTAQPGATALPIPYPPSLGPIPNDRNLLVQALRANQESLQTLAQMQQQNAELHRRFLENQEQVTRSFELLAARQQAAFGITAAQPQPVSPPLAVSPVATAPASPQMISAPTPPAVATAAPAPADAPEVDAATPVLLEVVAAKTGYPVEMLELSMSLDSDLGIDSIKRVEILSALQERLPSAPVVKPEHLGELTTLGHIADFLSAGDTRALGSSAPDTNSPIIVESTRADSARVEAVLLSVVAEKTGYPAEMLELSMGLDADLGIDSIKRVEILATLQEQLPAAPVVKPEHLGELQTLAQIVDFLAVGSTRAPAPTSPGVGVERLQEILLRIVADKTGYPAEMLELSMGLDADLGIDSIKRVEILSALQEQLPDAPAVKPEHLGELQTLQHIVEFLAAGATTTAAPAAPAIDTGQLREVLLAIVAEKTGYPAEMLELSMSLDTDLGIDSIKRVEILSALQERLPEAPVVKPEHLGELQTLQHIVEFLAGGTLDPVVPQPAVTAIEPATSIDRARPGIARLVPSRRQVKSTAEAKSDLPDEALVWVTRSTDGLSSAIVDALHQLGVKADEVECATTATPPTELCGLILVASLGDQARFLHQAFALTRHLGSQLRGAGEAGAARYLTVSRLDGSFGLGDLGDAAVLSGGLAGLSKTVGHEWPRVDALAVDLDRSESDVEWAARQILARFLEPPEHGEVGISRYGNCVIELVDTDLQAGDPVQQPLQQDDVVLVTGGARGVTAEVAVSLATAFRCALVLLGRSPKPSDEPAWLRNLDDETSIKQAILERVRVDEPQTRLSPRDLNQRYRSITNNREILRNIARMEQAGARVLYQQVDVRDAAALEACLGTVEAELGPVSGVVHGAGVLADSYIIDKTDEEFDLVWSTKVGGAIALLDALADVELKVLVHFASSTARFGRTGQGDYAAANEVLNKLAQRESRRRPQCRVVSINWGPWDGGMVTPALRGIFAGEGIAVIDLRTGADYLVDELRNTNGPVELVILGQGSVLPGMEADISEAAEEQAVLIPTLNLVPELPTVMSRTLALDDHPFLRSHVLDGKAVLPVAVMIEWLGHGALHGNPGLRLLGVRDLRVFRGVTLADGDCCDLRICADKAQKFNGVFGVVTELCSTDGNGARVLYARATIELGTARAKAPPPPPAAVLPPYESSIEAAYADELFHGTHLQGLTSITGCATDLDTDAGIVAHCNSAPAPREWIHQPPRSQWITDPLAIDAAFQLMILWSWRANGMASLPTSIGHYQQFTNSFPDDGLRIEVRVRDNSPGRAVADIDWLDATGAVVARMTDYQCVVDASLRTAFRRNALETKSAISR